jgi:hypothetical protein
LVAKGEGFHRQEWESPNHPAKSFITAIANSLNANVTRVVNMMSRMRISGEGARAGSVQVERDRAPIPLILRMIRRVCTLFRIMLQAVASGWVWRNLMPLQVVKRCPA